MTVTRRLFPTISMGGRDEKPFHRVPNSPIREKGVGNAMQKWKQTKKKQLNYRFFRFHEEFEAEKNLLIERPTIKMVNFTLDRSSMKNVFHRWPQQWNVHRRPWTREERAIHLLQRKEKENTFSLYFRMMSRWWGWWRTRRAPFQVHYCSTSSADSFAILFLFTWINLTQSACQYRQWTQ